MVTELLQTLLKGTAIEDGNRGQGGGWRLRRGNCIFTGWT